MRGEKYFDLLPMDSDLADPSHSSFDRARRGAHSDAPGIFDQVGGTPSKSHFTVWGRWTPSVINEVFKIKCLKFN